MREDLYPEMYRQEKTYWWHVAKRQLVKRFLQGKKILDVGCGTGSMLSELKESGYDAYGLDGSREALVFCRKRGLEKVKAADFEKPLPYPAGTFDTVLCLDVLEHVEHDDKLLSGIYELLQDGGRLILTVPAYQFLWTYWDEMLGHKRRYTLGQARKLVANSGLRVEKATYFFCPHSPAFIIRLIKSRLGGRQESDFVELPPAVNNFLLFAAAVERFLLRFINMPFGVSILIVAKK
ncbi:class I SAM-dependent methyltransferase [Patescibacteria group bacterium]|nr:class I SAM-dependent methyltransferase [Patescibacteria group bacterium]